MIKSTLLHEKSPNKGKTNDRPRNKKENSNLNNNQYKKLFSMGRVSIGIINELSSPIDSTNRFLNLALQTIGEDSQIRQFLLESKQGIRKASNLLRRLNSYAEKIEKELREISKQNG